MIGPGQLPGGRGGGYRPLWYKLFGLGVIVPYLVRYKGRPGKEDSSLRQTKKALCSYTTVFLVLG